MRAQFGPDDSGHVSTFAVIGSCSLLPRDSLHTLGRRGFSGTQRNSSAGLLSDPDRTQIGRFGRGRILVERDQSRSALFLATCRAKFNPDFWSSAVEGFPGVLVFSPKTPKSSRERESEIDSTA
jgi:hypothetical protein